MPEPKIEAEERNYEYKTFPKPWSKHDLAYWGQAGIGQSTLERLYIRPLSKFWAHNRYNKQYEIKARHDNPMYEYIQNGWSKIYLPYANSKYVSKFYTLGKKDPYYIFGIDSIDWSDKTLAINGGEKDVAAWMANVGNAICFNSEEANPADYPRFKKLLISGRFEKIVFIYDNDETGVRQMKRMAKMFGRWGATYKVLPQMPPYKDGKPRKDVFDFYELKHEKTNSVHL
jgi:hypothetical protein